MLEFEIHHFAAIKLALHCVQALLIFVAWAVEIAVFKATDSSIDGRPGWHFGLCFLTVPAIIFLTMVPRFPRTRKLANPYVMAAIDGVFCVFWLSAFASVASWNSAGKCGDGCGTSKAVVAISVVIWLLWVATTLMSLYAVTYFMREGYYPGLSRAPTNAQMIDPDKDAFSTAPHDDVYAPVQHDDHEIHNMGGPLDSHNYNSAPTYDGPPQIPGGAYSEASNMGGGLGGHTYESHGAGRYVSPSVEEETAYNPYGGHDTSYRGHSPAPVVGDNGRVHFPAARYDNVSVLGDRE
ncbi:hypothetical protein BJ878DRAFT_489092 [Calycina marina]|uniref:MARVEL domain-containing protein n=1 Tax=Calycina marina TaxID=1763456 RepID=A0A9P7ZA00_9HELO|nr:hypothetical protein BJ878DRAFT_489092 [Calycina marina]